MIEAVDCRAMSTWLSYQCPTGPVGKSDGDGLSAKPKKRRKKSGTKTECEQWRTEDEVGRLSI